MLFSRVYKYNTIVMICQTFSYIFFDDIFLTPKGEDKCRKTNRHRFVIRGDLKRFHS